MKKFLFICLVALAMVGCSESQQVLGTDGKPLSKEESAKVVKNTIDGKVKSRDFRILVSQMNPMYGPMLHLRDNDWALEVHGDSIGSILPYIGRGYNVPYGSAMGYHFITRMDSYTYQQVKDDQWQIEIKCHNLQEAYDFRIDIYDNGHAYINAISRYRDNISYSGEVDLNGLALKRVK